MESLRYFASGDRGWYQPQHPSRRSRLLHPGRTRAGTDLDAVSWSRGPENGTLRGSRASRQAVSPVAHECARARVRDCRRSL